MQRRFRDVEHVGAFTVMFCGARAEPRARTRPTACRKIDDLAPCGGWEPEYPRPVWQLRCLGFDGNQTLVFDVISQPWLVELTKRWLRWRLSTGLHPTTVREASAR